MIDLEYFKLRASSPMLFLKNELLRPTKIYVKEVLNLINKNLINGCANITGGGLADNIKRVIPDNLIAAIITPDKDIIPNSENLEPAYIVFENYEKILQWNRSLRFALAVCTLKGKFEDVL